jgi:thioredoxin-like negative regulator of GroEL
MIRDSFTLALHGRQQQQQQQFFVPRCPPCRRIAPVLDALARQHPDDVLFIKVDVDKLPSIKTALGVWAMPSFYFFKHGNKVGSFMGADEALLKRGIANGGRIGMCSSMLCSIQ